MSKKKVFKMPYIGIDSEDEAMHILYGLKGESTVVMSITNSVVQFSANPSDYMAFHHTMLNAIKILGEGYFLQKLDVLSKAVYQGENGSEYLQKKYDEHFRGRVYNMLTTYLAITKLPVKPSAKSLKEFKQQVSKVQQLLETNGFRPSLLTGREINTFITRMLAMDFRSPNIVLDNMEPTDTHIKIGGKLVKCLSLIDIDRIDLPEKVTPYIEMNDKEALKGFPVDTMAFLHHVPAFETIIYNQVLEIPKQAHVIQKLEVKRKRHSGIPDPANELCVEDIDRLMADVARKNQLLVNAHFNIIACATEENLKKAVNYIENALFTQGIIPSRNSCNQLELFRAALVGNAVELKDYDLFLTTSDAALTFFFKEALPVSEHSPTGFYIRFTDRQGIPLKIDVSDLPMQSGRISNRSKFVLGGSGTGKSFFMNALIEQYLLYNMDVVIIDTGDSYSGISSYYAGKYITYKPEKPITMNPFAIKENEYNLEKKDFLQTLVLLLWKGADGKASTVEADVISDVITEYYRTFFGQKDKHRHEGMTISELEERLFRFGVDTDLLLREAREATNMASKWTKDYYQVLQLPTTATMDEVKGAFRRLAFIHHPDRKGESDTHNAAFIEIVEAYNVLSNADKRREYDRAGKSGILATIATREENPGKGHDSRLTAIYMDILKREIISIDKRMKVERLSFDSFYDFALLLIPLIKKKEHIPFDLNEFRFVLKKFYRGGEFESILNEEADGSLFEEKLIVFEIDQVKDNKVLFPIITLIIMDIFIQKMRWRQNQRKALIVEEAWKAIASPMMAGYLLYLYKTVRKFLGEAIVVTQELSDIIGNHIVKDSIINNSDTICLLDQTKFRDNYDQIATLLSINEVERRKIFTINNLDNKEYRGRFKEVYIRRGSTGEVYGVEVSLQQYLTYTTEKPEKLAVESYATHYGSYPDGLDAFVAHMSLTGLPLPGFVKLVNSIGTALADPAIELLKSYRQKYGEVYLDMFQRDFAESYTPFNEWVRAKRTISGYN